jgi:hypothetical protein
MRLTNKEEKPMSPEQYKMITSDIMSKKRLLSVIGIILLFAAMAALAYIL